MRFFLPLALLACGPRIPDPDPCDAMCVSAATLYGGCLVDQGLEWSAAGYVDEGDFEAACNTWAWEMRWLEHDAGQTGTVDAACVDREARFSAGSAECADYTSIDWSAPTWEAL